MSSIMCGKCKSSHGSVGEVRACYAGQPFQVTATSPSAPVALAVRATEKQLAFITRLASDRSWEWALDSDFGPMREVSRLVGDAISGKALGKREASQCIEWLQGQPIAIKTPEGTLVAWSAEAPTAVELGMYRKGDDLFRVYPARNGGHLLCKRLVQGEGSWSFDYVGSPKRAGLTTEHRMTLEEAKAFGAQFGVCCVCAALLTDPTSVANGIGPVCGSRV